MNAMLLSGPALEPVALLDAKAHLRVDHDEDDALISAAIVSARLHVEAATRRVLIAQGWRVGLDRWPRKRILRLPAAPLISVDAVRIRDAEGGLTTLDAADYEVDAVSVPGRLAVAATAPAPATRMTNAIEIDVTAGYGATSLAVPSPLRHAIMMLVTHWYEHRGPAGHDQAGDTAPQGYAALIAPYRVLSLCAG
ncbi:MAG: head-tail connector protein [Bauldia sp.]|nr:head-tail connector protein [Bauldia sp.]